MRHQPFVKGHLAHGVLVTGLGGFLDFLHPRLHRFQIFQLKLCVDHLLVADGVHTSIHMDDVVVFKTTQDVKDGISGSDVAQELVSEPLSFARPLHEAGNVHNFHCGGDDILGLHQLRKFVQTRVGHGDDAKVGLNGAKRKVCALCLCIGKTIEEGGFADVGQTDNAALQGHVVLRLRSKKRKSNKGSNLSPTSRR